MVTWKHIVLSLILSLSFTGCTTLMAPETTKQKQAYVDTTIKALADTVSEGVKKDTISRTDAVNAAEILQKAATANDMSKGILKPDGKLCSDELSCLRFAQDALRMLQDQLKARK